MTELPLHSASPRDETPRLCENSARSAAWPRVGRASRPPRRASCPPRLFQEPVDRRAGCYSRRAKTPSAAGGTPALLGAACICCGARFHTVSEFRHEGFAYLQSGVQRPSRNSWSASSASASNRPAATSSSKCRSHASASNSQNQSRKAANSSRVNLLTAAWISGTVFILRDASAEFRATAIPLTSLPPMNISEPFIRRPIATSLLMAGVVMHGHARLFAAADLRAAGGRFPDHPGHRAVSRRQPGGDGLVGDHAARAAASARSAGCRA